MTSIEPKPGYPWLSGKPKKLESSKPPELWPDDYHEQVRRWKTILQFEADMPEAKARDDAEKLVRLNAQTDGVDLDFDAPIEVR